MTARHRSGDPVDPLELLQAFGLGTLAQSSLLLAGLFACWVKVPKLIVGILAGFGAGAMISAVSFDLVPQAQENIAEWETVLWMLIGVAIFLVGDKIVDKKFGTAGAGAAMGIVVGSVVDGVPESVIFGIQIGTGTAIRMYLPHSEGFHADEVSNASRPMPMGLIMPRPVITTSRFIA